MLHRIPIWAATLLLTVPAHAGTDFDDGPTVHLVYLGSSTCGPCLAPPTKEAVRGAIVAVEQWSRESGSVRSEP